MLDPNKDYTAIESFDLGAINMVTTQLATPAEACTQGCSTETYFFRFRINNAKIEYQRIAWADIDNPAKWAHATNNFVVLTKSDPGDYFRVGNLADDQIVVLHEAASETHFHTITYDDATGWSAESAEIAITASNFPYVIPYCGYGYFELSGGLISIQKTVSLVADYPLPYDYNYCTGDPAPTSAWGFYSQGRTVCMAYNASSQLRFYFAVNCGGYVLPANFGLKWAYTPRAVPLYSQAGSTLFLREGINGQVRQGFHPFHIAVIYDYPDLASGELPCAEHDGSYYTYSGTRFTPTKTILGQISGFSGNKNTFNCTVPVLTGAYTEPCTVFLRRTYTDATSADSNPMLVTRHQSTNFGNQFTCAKTVSETTYLSFLPQLADSQPHLQYTHSLLDNPINFDGAPTSVAGLLERYKLIFSHDTGQLLTIDDNQPAAALSYELYTLQEGPQRQYRITYRLPPSTDSLNPPLLNMTIPGEPPAIPHNAKTILNTSVTPTLFKEVAFSNLKGTYELIPQHIQVGDQVTVDTDKTGMVIDLRESFSPQKWRHNLTLLLRRSPIPGTPRVWYDAHRLNYGTNDVVASLTDISGNGNHGIPNPYVAGNGARQPYFAYLYDYPSIYMFGGTTPTVYHYFELTNPIEALEQLTFFIILYTQDAAENRCILTYSDTEYLYLQYNTVWYREGNCAPIIPMTTNYSRNLRSFTKYGENCEFYANGVNAASLTDGDITSRFKYIGLPWYLSSFYLHEFIFYDRVLTASEMNTVHNHLIQRYNLP